MRDVMTATQDSILKWSVNGLLSAIECEVSVTDSGFRVVASVSGQCFCDEMHPTCESALRRASDLRTFLQAEGVTVPYGRVFREH
jgi:hypothetical protein